MSFGLPVSVILSFLLTSGCTSGPQVGVQVKSKIASDVSPNGMPEMIWVANFDIDRSDIKEDQGILGGGRTGRRGPLGREGGPIQRLQPSGPTADHLVDLLSSSLTQELADRSLPAMRQGSGRRSPNRGWVIEGQFLEVDEGNRLRRAMIGFGAGETDMQLQVRVYDLAENPNAPFLVFGTQAESGKMPGAAITMNPYVAAAKFVLSKNATDKDVKHTAARIASEIVDYMQVHGLMPSK